VKSQRKLWLFRLVACTGATLFGVVAAVLLWPVLQRALRGPAVYFEDPNFEQTGIRMLYDDRFGWRNVPGMKATSFGKPLTINSLGHRDPDEYDKAPPPDTTRILFLGDSFCWGFGVGDEEVVTEVLEDNLRASGYRCEVLNSGVVGWSTDQEYLYLMHCGVELSPDIVILMFCLNNDIYHNSVSRHGDPMFVQKPRFLNLDLDVTNVPVPRPEDNAPIQTYQGNPFELTAALIRNIAASCESQGASFMVLKYASHEGPDGLVIRRSSTYFADWAERSLPCAYYDLNVVLDNQGVSEPDITEHGHWNRDGHRRIAAFIEQRVIETGRSTSVGIGGQSGQSR